MTVKSKAINESQGIASHMSNIGNVFSHLRLDSTLIHRTPRKPIHTRVLVGQRRADPRLDVAHPEPKLRARTRPTILAHLGDGPLEFVGGVTQLLRAVAQRRRLSRRHAAGL